MNLHVRVFAIGTLGKAAGVSAPTIRHYDQIGLLPPPSRSSGGQRYYDEADLRRLTFIRQCRDFGFNIEEFRNLIALSISNDRDCQETRDIAQNQLTSLRQRIVELGALEKRLVKFVEQCDVACAGGPGRDCVIFSELMAASPPTRYTCCQK